jgi:hypothetical protein
LALVLSVGASCFVPAVALAGTPIPAEKDSMTIAAKNLFETAEPVRAQTAWPDSGKRSVKRAVTGLLRCPYAFRMLSSDIPSSR